MQNGGGDEEQLVVASHCEINEFFTIGTLTAAGWVSRSVEPFMTMMRPIPRNDRNTIEWASWVGCNEKHGGGDPLGKLREKKRSTFIGEKFVLEERRGDLFNFSITDLSPSMIFLELV